MPSHTIQSTLIGLFLTVNGAPWGFDKWKQITGVSHGLFPDDPFQLPSGWSPEDAEYINQYFDQYEALGSEDEKAKFAASRSNAANTAHVPGRDIFRKWVSRSWGHWRIHAKIEEVLRKNSLHPLILMRAQGTLDWPNGCSYIPLVVDPVGKELFGEEALDSLGLVSPQLRAPMQGLITRTWINTYNQFRRNKTRLADLEKKTTLAFDQIDIDKPTKKSIKEVILMVSRWKKLAAVLQSTSNMEKMEAMDSCLTELMSELGAKIKVVRTKSQKKYTKVSPQALRKLASEENVLDVINLYNDFFNTPAPEDSVDLANQRPALPLQFGNQVDDATLGVEEESKLPPEVLAHNLGFPEGRPLLFNSHRHRGGLSAWDPANAPLYERKNAEKNPEMEEIKLHWHQMAGVHSIARKLFSPTPTPNPRRGMLIADEVGLGKTYQAATLIALLSDRVTREQLKDNPNIKLPPIFQINPYLREQKELPSLPHLILAPGTLIPQWESELRSLFLPHSFSILVYGVGKQAHADFWAPDGAFHTAQGNASQKIILASHSALQQDFSLIYMWRKPPRGEIPWQKPTRLPSYKTLVKDTLFGQRFLSGTLDEAHDFRNYGAKHSAALTVLDLVQIRLPNTATPLQTSTKDIAAMGRLVGLPYFLSEDAYDEEKTDARNIRKAKGGDFEDGAFETDPSKEVQMFISQRMQYQFDGSILRRTLNSLKWNGEPLIVLPPYDEIMLVVKLMDWEMEIITELADRIKESASASNSVLQIVSKSFYIEHRLSVCYARLDPKDDLPDPNTLDEWLAKKSTKFDTCARLLLHCLARDNPPDAEVRDGVLFLPDIPPLKPGEIITQDDKAMVFHEFPCVAVLLCKVLALYGIKFLYIDGNISIQKRAKIVEQFCTGKEYRVLIVSSVGATGLNLAVASTVIFVDQPWSAQDEKQIRGRVHRQPQKKVVKCYHILADETADIVLHSLARGKKSMLDAFLQKNDGQDMYDLLRGKNVAGPEEDLDREELKAEKRGQKNARKTQRESKKSKKAAEVSDSEKTDKAQSKTQGKGKKTTKEVVNASNPKEKGKKQRKKKAISPEVVNSDIDMDDVGKSHAEPHPNKDLAPAPPNPEEISMGNAAGMGSAADDAMDIDEEAPVSTPGTGGTILQEVCTLGSAASPMAGDRRQRAVCPDSPEVAKEKKRFRVLSPVANSPSSPIVDYPSSPVYPTSQILDYPSSPVHPTSHIVDYPSSLVSGSPVSGLPIANYAKAAVSQDNEHDTADPLQIDMDQVRQPHLQSFPTEKLEKISRPAIQQPPSTTQPDPLPATAPAQPHKVAVMKPGNRSKAHQRNALSSAVTDSFLRRMEETLSSDEEPFLPQGGPSPLLPSADILPTTSSSYGHGSSNQKARSISSSTLRRGTSIRNVPSIRQPTQFGGFTEDSSEELRPPHVDFFANFAKKRKGRS